MCGGCDAGGSGGTRYCEGSAPRGAADAAMAARLARMELEAMRGSGRSRGGRGVTP
jgi:hypothetical protein